MSPETRIVDLKVGDLMSLLKSTPVAPVPAVEQDPVLTIEAFMKEFSVCRTQVNSMRRRKKNKLPFMGKGRLSRILKSEAVKWWKEHVNEYQK